jgi:hypothetical protein
MPKQNKNALKYAGLATQLFVSLGVGVFLGMKVDQWIRLGIPLAIWLFPLGLLAWNLIRIVRDTGPGK